MKGSIFVSKKMAKDEVATSSKKKSSSKEKRDDVSSKKKSSSSSSKKKEKSSSKSEEKSSKSSKEIKEEEDDEFDEKQFILRVPEDVADKIRQKLKKGTSKSSDKAHRVNLNMNIKFGDDVDILQFLQSARMSEEDSKLHSNGPESDKNGYLSDVEYGIDKNRRGRFQLDKEVLPCTLVDLPTHVEAYKSIDCQTYYKCGDVSQMIVVQKPQELDKDLQKARQRRSRYYQQRNPSSKVHHHHHHEVKRKAKDLMISYCWEDGITPPMERVLRHWNSQKLDITRKDIKKMKEKYIQMLEEEDPTKVKIEILEYTSEQERLAAAEEESSSSSDSDDDSDDDSEESDNMFDEVSASKMSGIPQEDSNMSAPLSSTGMPQPFRSERNRPAESDESMSEGERSQTSSIISKMNAGKVGFTPSQMTPSSSMMQMSDQEGRTGKDDEETSSDDSDDDEDDAMFDEVASSNQPAGATPQSIDVTTTPAYQNLLAQKSRIEGEVQAIQGSLKQITEKLQQCKNDIQRKKIQEAYTIFKQQGGIKQQEYATVERELNNLRQQGSSLGSSSSSVPPF